MFDNPILISLLGGVLPALVWLAIWLREDIHPEPKKRISATFLFGMLSVVIVLPLQLLFFKNFSKEVSIESISAMPIITAFIVLTIWAFAEEFIKFLAARFGGLIHKEMDEPIDAVIYLMTAALGFAAMENALYIFADLNNLSFIDTFLAGYTRFIGPTLLHLATSGIIGFFIAYSFKAKKKRKLKYLLSGILIASLLHTAFNVSIITDNKLTLPAFSFVWFILIVFLAMFERVKQLKKTK